MKLNDFTFKQKLIGVVIVVVSVLIINTIVTINDMKKTFISFR